MDNERDTKSLSGSRAESGQKLLSFLQRRVNAPASDFHRWIRTGQVRVNGARAKAFDRLNEGDLIRIPPFAERLPAGSGETLRNEGAAGKKRSRLPIVFEDENILVLAKPAGLPSQDGTGHRESVASILAEERAGAAFVPAPAHRLDKDTSGLLAAGKTYAALRLLTDALAGRGERRPRKEYLAWVEGLWPRAGTVELKDMLAKDERERRVKTLVSDSDRAEAKEARCEVTRLESRSVHGRTRTLLLIRLLTGRTHQIRVQLSSRGHPIVGDTRYGDGASREGLKLHAFRLSIPLPGGRVRDFELLPPWKGAWRYAPEDKPVSHD